MMAESIQTRETMFDPQTFTELSLKPISGYGTASTDVNTLRSLEEDESTLLISDISVIASDDLTITFYDGESIVYKMVVVGTANVDKSFKKPLVFKTGISTQCDSNSAEVFISGMATYKKQVSE